MNAQMSWVTVVLPLVGWVAVSSGAQAAEGKRYFIDEVTDFTGNGCANTDLNTVTASLKTALDGFSWTGSRYVNADAWPQDFSEWCSDSYGTGGLDYLYGDNSLLSVYAGHGNTGGLMFGWMQQNRCWAMLGSNMRLGSMSGSDAGYGMWLTSCTLKVESLPAQANNQWLRQQLGFHNSPSIDDDTLYHMMWDMRNGAAGTRTNMIKWLGFMDQDMNGDEENSPVVVSYGNTSAQAAAVRDTASLARDVLITDRDDGPSCGGGQPVFWYNWVRENNGSSPGCN